MAIGAMLSNMMHNASGFLFGLLKGKADSAFGALFSKGESDEAALEWALVQANRIQPGVSGEFMAILGEINDHQNEQIRKVIGMLISMDHEALKENKDFELITPKAIIMIVEDLKGKDAATIAKRLSLPESALWRQIYDGLLELKWPQAYGWVKATAEKIALDTPYWSLVKHRLSWEEKALAGGIIHIDRYRELLERWLAANPGKTESEARKDNIFHEDCLSAIRVHAGRQERELESAKKTFLPKWAKVPIIIGVIVIASSAIITSII